MPLRPLPALLAAVLLAGCSATPDPASPTATPPVHKDASAMPSAPGTAPAPAATAETDAATWLGRLLALVKDSHSLADLTRERVDAAMGVRVEAQAGQPDGFGTGGHLAPDWTYNFGMEASADGRAFQFSFDPVAPGAQPRLTDICGMDAEAFAAALQAQGFTRATYAGEHGRPVSEQFERDQLHVDVYTQGESADTPTHACVQRVTIY